MLPAPSSAELACLGGWEVILAGGSGGGSPGTGSGGPRMLRVPGAGGAPSPRLPPSELREKSGKSVGESRAAAGEGPAERLAGGGGEHPSSRLWLPGACGRREWVTERQKG